MIIGVVIEPSLKVNAFIHSINKNWINKWSLVIGYKAGANEKYAFVSIGIE